MKVYECRLCKGRLSEPKLNLGSTPLANEFVKEIQAQELFPLEICVCETCGHYQLNQSINPERIFRNYAYVAGTSLVNVEHFRQYAKHMIELFDLKPGNRVLDIGSNDGTLLKQFLDLKMSVLGIDPARNLAAEANKNGIPTIPDFFTEECADKMLKQHEQFHLITANNVWAHVPDMIGFIKGIKKLLKPNGVFSFEVSYFVDVCDKTLFDTCYHEHSSYHTLVPLIKFFKTHDLNIFDVENIPNHGGSIRVFVKHKARRTHHENYPKHLYTLLQQEKNIDNKINKLKNNIMILGLVLHEALYMFKQQGKSLAIYGTPAKATTLMYSLDIDEKLIDFAVDDNPLKQGTYTPGKHVPVYAPQVIYEKKPDVLLVLAWNFAESIIKEHNNFKGTWIVPLPEYKEYNVAI